MAINPQKIEQAKKLFGVTDSDIQRIVGGQQTQETPMIQQSQQPQGDFMSKLTQSRALPTAGGVAGSIVGNVAGPVGRLAGAPALAGAGEQISQMAQGKSGDPLAALSPLGPLPQLLNAIPHAIEELKGQKPKLSSVEKVQQTALGSQVVGEALGLAFQFLKPGVTSKLFNDITNFLSKKGKGGVDMSKIQSRFLNETLPKALKSSGEMSEEAITKKGAELLSKTNTKFFDTQDLNYVRQQFNAVGGGKMNGDLTKFLANDLARILKEEQLKLVPKAGASLGAEKLTYQIPNILRRLPFGQFFLGSGQGGNSGLLGLGGKAISGLMSKFNQFGGGPLIGLSGQEEQNE